MSYLGHVLWCITPLLRCSRCILQTKTTGPAYFLLERPFLEPLLLCDEKWILYNWQWIWAPKHFPNLKLCQKKVTVISGQSTIGIVHNHLGFWQSHPIVKIFAKKMTQFTKNCTVPFDIGQSKSTNSSRWKRSAALLANVSVEIEITRLRN